MAKRAAKTATKRKVAAKAKKAPARGKPKKWVAGVTTVSTYPPEGLFTESAAAIAKSLASKKVSPKGPASGMRMLNYYINRAGRNLPDDRKRVLEEAKTLLSKRIAASKEKDVKTRPAAN